MTTSMEVDSASKGADDGPVRIALHPLAIVHMSDQYTRITSGGSPLPRDSPVVGLLFGTDDTAQRRTLDIHDADEIPVQVTDASALQIDLHRAVFPQHAVVGWYRVSHQDEPTSHDLAVTRTLKEHFQFDDFVYCQLQVQATETTSRDTKHEAKSDEPSSTLDQELPINLYQLHTPQDDPSSSVLLAVDDSHWNLATSESERIAVERVIREQPVQSSSFNNNNNNNNNDSTTVPSSHFSRQVESLQFSLRSMNDRIDLLVQFLEDTHKGKIPHNHALVRDVVSLTTMLGPIAAHTRRQSSDMDAHVLGHLATLGKLVNVVQAYTEAKQPSVAGTKSIKQGRRTA